jgi:protein-tyrosine-phosphatase
MSNSKFVDPRLQAREHLFQNLHLSVFETMGYAHTIQVQVERTGQDIEPSNPDYLQLLRDYEITKNLAPIAKSTLEDLCNETDNILKMGVNALANCAQLCAAATIALNHWRILDEVPTDLRDNDIVTKTLKEKFNLQMQTWSAILEDLSGKPNRYENA